MATDRACTVTATGGGSVRPGGGLGAGDGDGKGDGGGDIRARALGGAAVSAPGEPPAAAAAMSARNQAGTAAWAPVHSTRIGCDGPRTADRNGVDGGTSTPCGGPIHRPCSGSHSRHATASLPASCRTAQCPVAVSVPALARRLVGVDGEDSGTSACTLTAPSDVVATVFNNARFGAREDGQRVRRGVARDEAHAHGHGHGPRRAGVSWGATEAGRGRPGRLQASPRSHAPRRCAAVEGPATAKRGPWSSDRDLRSASGAPATAPAPPQRPWPAVASPCQS